jgi:uncharacterized protein (UPF0548 family)
MPTCEDAMFFLRKPSPSAIQAFLQSQSGLPLTYPAVGATLAVPPAGYVVDHTRVRLGTGPEVFAAACAALRRWDQFRLGWLETWPPDVPLRTDEVVAMVARSGGLWCLSACRIVAVIDEEQTHGRFGFAYGTLPDHPGSGEERFLVERDARDDSVWYDVLAFSRLRALFARLGYPWVRRVQKRFGPASAVALQRGLTASGAVI